MKQQRSNESLSDNREQQKKGIAELLQAERGNTTPLDGKWKVCQFRRGKRTVSAADEHSCADDGGSSTASMQVIEDEKDKLTRHSQGTVLAASYVHQYAKTSAFDVRPDAAARTLPQDAHQGDDDDDEEQQRATQQAGAEPPIVLLGVQARDVQDSYVAPGESDAHEQSSKQRKIQKAAQHEQEEEEQETQEEAGMQPQDDDDDDEFAVFGTRAAREEAVKAFIRDGMAIAQERTGQSTATGAQALKASKRYSNAVAGTVAVDLAPHAFPSLFADVVRAGGLAAAERPARAPESAAVDDAGDPLPLLPRRPTAERASSAGKSPAKQAAAPAWRKAAASVTSSWRGQSGSSSRASRAGGSADEQQQQQPMPQDEAERRFSEELSPEQQEAVEEFVAAGTVASLSEALRMIDAFRALGAVGTEQRRGNAAVAQAILSDASISRAAPRTSSVADVTDVDMQPQRLAAVTTPPKAFPFGTARGIVNDGSACAFIATSTLLSYLTDDEDKRRIDACTGGGIDDILAGCNERFLSREERRRRRSAAAAEQQGVDGGGSTGGSGGGGQCSRQCIFPQWTARGAVVIRALRLAVQWQQSGRLPECLQQRIAAVAATQRKGSGSSPAMLTKQPSALELVGAACDEAQAMFLAENASMRSATCAEAAQRERAFFRYFSGVVNDAVDFVNSVQQNPVSYLDGTFFRSAFLLRERTLFLADVARHGALNRRPHANGRATHSQPLGPSIVWVRSRSAEAVEAAIDEAIMRWQTDRYLARRAAAAVRLESPQERSAAVDALWHSARCWEADACKVIMAPGREGDARLTEADIAQERERRAEFLGEDANKDILELRPRYILIGLRPSDADIDIAQRIEALAAAEAAAEEARTQRHGPLLSASSRWSNVDGLRLSQRHSSSSSSKGLLFARTLKASEKAAPVTEAERAGSAFADPQTGGYVKCAVVFNPHGTHWVTQHISPATRETVTVDDGIVHVNSNEYKLAEFYALYKRIPASPQMK